MIVACLIGTETRFKLCGFLGREEELGLRRRNKHAESIRANFPSFVQKLFASLIVGWP